MDKHYILCALLFLSTTGCVHLVNGQSWASHDDPTVACTNVQHYIYYTWQCSFTARTHLIYYIVYGEDYFDNYEWSSTSHDFDIDIDVCGDAMGEFDSCMNELKVCMNADFVDEQKAHYRDLYCDGSNLKSSVQQYEGQLSQENFVNLLGGLGCMSAEDLVGIFLEENSTCAVDYTEFDYDASIEDSIFRIRASKRRAFTCVLDQVKNVYGCSDSEIANMEVFLFYMYVWFSLPGIDVPFEEIYAGFDQSDVDTRVEARSTVAVFGDPHLYIYGAEEGQFVTCAAEGADILYLRNGFVEIVGKNEAAFPGSDATYMTAVTIYFFEGDDTVTEYSAGASSLGSDFVSNSGDAEIDTRTEDESILITSEYAGVVISLQRFSHTYMLVARMADTLYQEGLLVTGCLDAIDIDQESRRRKRQTSDACAGVDAAYQATCEFDYQETGDPALAAGPAQSMPATLTQAESYDDVMVRRTDNGCGRIGEMSVMLILVVVGNVAAQLF